ncbi:MAG: hypothetical protein FGM46_02050 [Ferruginibacter sp.]|nr:hypothetical protein [Ferruginibacter sp.]
MEDETRAFLVLIANTISKVLLWMMANVFFGIYMGWGFFEISPDWKNWLYYFLFGASFVLLFWHLKRKWKI